MVNELPHRRPCVCFAYARGTNGWIMQAVSAATNGSNARFWWLTSFTIRDDHAAFTSRLCEARCASGFRPAFFFGAPHPFLWARPKKWGGKKVCRGLALALRPAAQSAALCHRAQSDRTQCGWRVSQKYARFSEIFPKKLLTIRACFDILLWPAVGQVCVEAGDCGFHR